MAKFKYTFVLLLVLLFASCRSVEEISIDYMIPADISFPSELRRVAIVNNTTSTPDNRFVPADSTLKVNEISKSISYHNGKPSITVQALAEAISAENYFDVVIVCDSLLRANDIIQRENMLSKEEVGELTQSLQADLIISLENLQMKATRIIRYIPDWNAYQGTIDMTVLPTVKVYIPNRKGPMATVNAKDSIFWEELGTSESYVRTHLAGNNVMLDEASQFAGVAPIKHIVPTWKTSKRYIYAGGSVNMRDAIIYARENSWDAAFKLWEEEYQSTKSNRKQMYAALNIALYHEMKDSIEQAAEWAVKAQTLARKVDRIGEGELPANINFTTIPNYVLTSLYVAELQERINALPKLKMQMSRFYDNF